MSTLLLYLLISLSGDNSLPGVSIGQELTDIHRGMHSRSMGYLDVGQMQDLRPVDQAEHQAYGRLTGFQETRRITMIMMGPDSTAITRLGLMGSWQTGGWTPDVYLTSPPSLHQQVHRWAAGLAGSRTDQGWFVTGGWFHTDPVEWKDDFGYRTQDPQDDVWSSGRFRRIGALAVLGSEGFHLARLSYLPDPTVFNKYDHVWFWPQVEGALVWEDSAWNPWSNTNALGAELRVPLLGDRLLGRLHAGQDGFRLAQIQSNLDPQGNVGVDLSWSRSRGTDGLGLRFRAPLLTFSYNDPDDVAAFGMSHKGIVWSLRFIMTWENTDVWYHPGRRPDGGASP